MKWTKYTYIQEYFRCKFDERYEPYGLMEEYAKNEYEYHREEMNDMIRDSQGRFMSFEDWQNSEKGWSIFNDGFFWEDFEEQALSGWGEEWGEGSNKFIFERDKKDYKVRLCWKDYCDGGEVTKYKEKLVQLNDFAWVSLETGKIVEFETGYLGESFDWIDRYVNWSKEFKKWAFNQLQIDLEDVEDCTDEEVIIKCQYDKIRIYKNKEKVEWLEWAENEEPKHRTLDQKTMLIEAI
jgi:hypothetical protein